MHCPNCGKATSAEQKFCRACGLGLEKFSSLLAERLALEARGGPEAEGVARLRERQQRVEHWLGVASLSFVTLVIGLVIFAIVYGLMINKGEILKGLVLLGLVLAAATSLALVFYNESLKEKIGRPTSEPELPQAPTAELLPEARFEPVHTVTERTTELLEKEPYRER